MANEWIGKTIGGRYIIEELLGSGGMSSVFKATDPNLKRVVAIKLIHPHLSNDPGFVRRFEEEATAVAQLRHPNIVQVFDYNNEGDTYYMVLEFIPGETLQERLKRLNRLNRHLPVEDIVEFGSNISSAADYAHQRGLIHRDIKPANVMLDVNSQGILMDFGIAKIVGGQQHTATGAVIGTAMYMSPEQIKGERPDPRSDVYSIGVTMYEMVSGRPPFEAESAMTLMMMHINDPVPDLREVSPDIPADLVEVINKALAKKPSSRYQSAGELYTALRKVASRIAGGASDNIPAQAAAAATMVDPTMLDMDASKMAGATSVPPATTHTSSSTMVEAPASGAAVFSAATTGLPNAGLPPAGSSTGIAQPAASGAGSGGAASYPVAGGSSGARRKISPLILAAAGIGVLLLICLVGGGIYFSNRFLGQGRGLAALPTATETKAAATEVLIQSVNATITPWPSATATKWSTATATPTETQIPSPTVPVGIPFSRINYITLEGSNYVVYYETFEFTEKLGNMHVHFFFNTVPPDEAGVPGSGPWILYGGPRPFTGYRTSDRPANATQMCILVANTDHSVQPYTGNCVDLP